MYVCIYIYFDYYALFTLAGHLPKSISDVLIFLNNQRLTGHSLEGRKLRKPIFIILFRRKTLGSNVTAIETYAPPLLACQISPRNL